MYLPLHLFITLKALIHTENTQEQQQQQQQQKFQFPKKAAETKAETFISAATAIVMLTNKNGNVQMHLIKLFLGRICFVFKHTVYV